jgi:subtilisin family serine protease
LISVHLWLKLCINPLLTVSLQKTLCYNEMKLRHQQENRVKNRLRILALVLLLALTLGVTAPRAQAAQPPSPMPAEQTASGRLLVGFLNKAALQAFTPPEGASVDASSKKRLAKINALLLLVPAGQEDEYRSQLIAEADVLFAEPDYLVETAETDPNDEYYPADPLNPSVPLEQYGPIQMNARQAWDVTTGSSSVILAIVDSGIDSGHPEFSGRLLPGYDFIQNDSTPQDDCGHGTHVAGSAAATGNNSIGIAGIDWQSRVLPVRVLGKSGTKCTGWTSDVAEGIVWAVEQGADVINLSLGLTGSSRLLEYATYYAYQHDVAVIAAAGNNNTAVLYPAAYPWVLAVGATQQNGTRASFSNYGAQLDVMAPGVDILSTTPRSGTLLSSLTNSYGVLDGTSMAAGHVAGAASLLAADSDFDAPDKIYEALTNTASEYPTHTNQFGYGIVDIYAALAFSPSEPAPHPSSDVEYDALLSTRCTNVNYLWRQIPSSALADAYSSATGSGYFFMPERHSFQTFSFPAGFSFEFGGAATPFTSATITANGYLSFDGVFDTVPSSISSAENYIIPLSDPNDSGSFDRPDWFIAPFWDDLDPSLPGSTAVILAHTFGTSPNRELVLEWRQVPIRASGFSSSVTFQIVLFENTGDILFQYQTLRGTGSDGSSATIGLEYNDGYSGTQVSYNRSGAVQAGQAIHFVRQSAGDTREPLSCLYADEVTSTGGVVDYYPWSLSVPAGLLDSDATVRISPFISFSPGLASYSSLKQYAEISLDPAPKTPLSPQPTVQYSYSAADLLAAGGRPQNLFLAVYNPNTGLWTRLPTVVDMVNQRLSASVPYLGIFGVFMPRRGEVGGAPSSLPVTGASQPHKSVWATISASVLLMSVIWLCQRKAKI